MLDRGQVGQQRRLADRLEDPHALDRELPAVARMAAPVAADLDRLARVHVGQRADEHDLLALVGHAVEHREVAVVEAEAHRGDLDRQRLHRPDRTRPSGLIRCGRMSGLGAILTAIVTPFDDDLRVDEEAFVDLLRHLCAHGSRRRRRVRHDRRGADARATRSTCA